MRRVFLTPRFEKKLAAFCSRHPELSAAVEAAVLEIAEDPRASSLGTHALHGNLAGAHAARISRGYRIVFVLDPGRVTFIDIGTHDDVYR